MNLSVCFSFWVLRCVFSLRWRGWQSRWALNIHENWSALLWQVRGLHVGKHFDWCYKMHILVTHCCSGDFCHVIILNNKSKKNCTWGQQLWNSKTQTDRHLVFSWVMKSSHAPLIVLLGKAGVNFQRCFQVTPWSWNLKRWFPDRERQEMLSVFYRSQWVSGFLKR